LNNQLKSIGLLFSGQVLIKSSNFLKQLLMAYFLGVSGRVDLLLVAQIIPNIIGSMISGGAGEILVTKTKVEDSSKQTFVTFFTFISTALIAIVLFLYWFFLPFVADKLDVSLSDQSLFTQLSFLLIVSKIFGSIVSCLQHLLYAKNLYKKFIVVSLIAELLGIIVILLFVKENHILAFAYGILVSTVATAILFVTIHHLPLKPLFNIEEWKSNWDELKSMYRKIFTLSLQTLMNHLSSFWERMLSFKYLQPGYLSALNYSKSLTELPKMAFLSSVLTTSYIEQNKRKEISNEKYLSYSNKVDALLNETAFFFQILSLLLSPFVLIVLYQRGAFDSSDVRLTLFIYQILTLGFLPGLMFNFLTRTMFIESEMKHLFWLITCKSIFEIIGMTIFITTFYQTIPVILTISKYLSVFYLYYYLNKKKSGIFNTRKSVKLYMIAIVVSLLLYFLNQEVINAITDLSIFELGVYYSPVLLFSLILSFYFIRNIKKKIVVS
jgi:peptidoglycan biosynthesis protein MviN/MurJ (putative lipid II flippase)